jgi:hypothetical protein
MSGGVELEAKPGIGYRDQFIADRVRDYNNDENAKYEKFIKGLEELYPGKQISVRLNYMDAPDYAGERSMFDHFYYQFPISQIPRDRYIVTKLFVPPPPFIDWTYELYASDKWFRELQKFEWFSDEQRVVFYDTAASVCHSAKGYFRGPYDANDPILPVLSGFLENGLTIIQRFQRVFLPEYTRQHLRGRMAPTEDLETIDPEYPSDTARDYLVIAVRSLLEEMSRSLSDYASVATSIIKDMSTSSYYSGPSPPHVANYEKLTADVKAYQDFFNSLREYVPLKVSYDPAMADWTPEHLSDTDATFSDPEGEVAAALKMFYGDSHSAAAYLLNKLQGVEKGL